MWIKTENGRLCNLSYAHLVEISTTGSGEYTVVVRGDSATRESTELIGPTTEDVARKVLQHVAEALATKEAYLDLTRPMI